MIVQASPVTSHLGGAAGVDLPIGRIVVAFVLCIVIAGLAIALLRRRMGHDGMTRWLRRVAPRKGAIEVVEVRRLNPHVDLGVVRYDGQEFLLLLHAQHPAILRERAAPVEATEE